MGHVRELHVQILNFGKIHPETLSVVKLDTVNFVRYTP